MNRLTYMAILTLSISFVFSDYTGVSGNKDKGGSFSFQKKRKGVIKKANQNSDLKVELMELEEEFKLDYNEIKNHYKEKILALKDRQKSEVKSLKNNYNNRKNAIYKKYGVKPPKKNEGDTIEGFNVYKPKKKERAQSPVKKSIK